MAEMEEGATRRDFINVASGAVGAVGVAAAAWPFINQMNPAADTLALSSTEVDVASVDAGMSDMAEKYRDGGYLYIPAGTDK